MISFRKFIEAINSAVSEANSGLERSNLGILDQFFTDDDGKSPLDYFNDPSQQIDWKTHPFKPRTVKVQYPDNSDNGTTEIDVPLITLVPVSASKIDTVKLSSEFRVSIVNDELQLDFPRNNGDGSFFKPAKGSIGTLEITLKPGDVSEGLDSLIEGYEKILKMQIPH
jgi:hypothetical protein